MGRPSTIARLPQDLREALEAWLRDPATTQTEAVRMLNGFLAERGLRPVSKSAVNRYSLSMDKVGERLRQSRAMAEAWVARLGSEPGGKVGQLVVEMLRTMVFEVSLKLQEAELDMESIPGVARQMRELSLTIERLERASRINEQRETEVRRRAAEELAAKAEAEAGPGGTVTTMQLRQIAREVYGIAA